MKNINVVYDIYSGPLSLENSATILKELQNYKLLNNEFNWEVVDFVGVKYVVVNKSNNFLIINTFTYSFDSTMYFFEDIASKGIPSFATRRFVEYSESLFYCISDPSSKPIYIPK
ncbi:MAG: hypothetical protein U0V72_11905 [Cytophagales bacterium]